MTSLQPTTVAANTLARSSTNGRSTGSSFQFLGNRLRLLIPSPPSGRLLTLAAHPAPLDRGVRQHHPGLLGVATPLGAVAAHPVGVQDRLPAGEVVLVTEAADVPGNPLDVRRLMIDDVAHGAD